MHNQSAYSQEKSAPEKKIPATGSIIEAADTGDLESAQILLERNRSLANLEPYDGLTPLCYAAAKGHKEVVELLIKYGANIKASCIPLIRAAEAGYADIVQLLLDHGAKDNIFEVSYLGMVNEIEKLLEKNPSLIRARDKGGWTATALHCAARGGAKEACQLLIEKGAYVDGRTKDNKLTPLMVAAEKGHTQVCGLLLDNGADVNAKDNSGKTPLALALERKKTSCVEFLRQHGVKK